MNRPDRRPARVSKSRLLPKVEPLEGRRLLTTFVVTSNASAGLGTLAAAITLSNADVTQINTIDFAIPGTSPQTIALTAPLPQVTQPVNIDATTQPGYVPNTSSTGDNEVPAVIIDGASAGAFKDGLDFAPMTAGGSIEGLQVQRFTNNGIFIEGNGVTLADDLIGVDPNNRAAPPGNGEVGVEVFDSSGVTIRDVESAGNGNDGVFVLRSSGVTFSGVDASSNLSYGVYVESSPGVSLSGVVANGEVAGGPSPGDGIRVNASDTATLTGVIASENAGHGINVSDCVGLDVTGSTAQDNKGGGILVNRVTGGSTIAGTTVGGSTSGLGNGTVGLLDVDSPGTSLSGDLIAGNAGPGIVVNAGSDATVVAPTIGSTTITGNAGDGLDVNGSTGLSLTSSVVLGNQGTGVSLANRSASADISGATIGGTAIGQANAGIGLLIVGSDNASVTGTTIMDDAGFGVELMRSDFASLANDTVGGTTKLGANLGDGVLAVLSRSLVLTGASITGNAGIGININQSAATSVQGTTDSTNAGGGLDLDESGSATVSGTTVGGTTSASGNGTVGVLIAGSTNASLTGVVVEGNTGNGIRVSFGSTSVQITVGTVSENTGTGILVSGSPMPSIKGGQVSGNHQVGVEFYYSFESSIMSCTIGTPDQPNQGDGIVVLGSDEVSVGGDSQAAGNSLSNNLGVGIVVENSYEVSIVYETVTSDASDGIDAFGDTRVVLDQDFVDHAAGVGINLSEDTASSAATALTVASSGGVGLLISSSPGLYMADDYLRLNQGGGAEANFDDMLTIGNSQFDGNGRFGLQVYDSTDVNINGGSGPLEASGTLDMGYPNGAGFDLIQLTNVTVSYAVSSSNQGPGIVILDGTGGTITSSTLGGTVAYQGNRGSGLLVQNSSGLTVGANGAPVLVETNAGNGIELDLSPNTALSSDTILSNQGDGIDLVASTGLSLSGSTVESQGGSGLVVTDGSDNATLNGNTISGNTGQDIVVTNSKNFVNND